MFTDKFDPRNPPIVHIVPGYAYYDEVGTGLAEKLVELVEFLAAALVPFRRQRQPNARSGFTAARGIRPRGRRP